MMYFFLSSREHPQTNIYTNIWKKNCFKISNNIFLLKLCCLFFKTMQEHTLWQPKANWFSYIFFKKTLEKVTGKCVKQQIDKI